MSKAKKLREALAESGDKAVCTAICDTLGITREMVERTVDATWPDEAATDVLTTILEVAGR